ncbi:MAG: DUF4981 domain-containing protein [Oscillospiraceae bacterium]|nr:DUF4981 domain-containing protein [Oscillospiraceae bacterium]
MKTNKFLSILLAGAILLSNVTAVLFPASADSLGDPWSYTADWPEMETISRLETGQTYFVHDEWTGSVRGDGLKTAEIFGINREDARASETLIHTSVELAKDAAINYKPENSPYYQLLTGEEEDWDLTVFKNYDIAKTNGIADNFYKTDYTGVTSHPYIGTGDVSSFHAENTNWSTASKTIGWRSVTLPASWQTQGFDFPIYVNTRMPWSGGAYGNPNDIRVPGVPMVTNPVGFYRHTFDINPELISNNKKVYITFAGVESAMYLYINGHEVGYTENSFDAHTFDITPFLTANGKDNLLAARVHRWCSGSWIEDQDFLRLAGIFRDVYLHSAPAVAIRDYWVTTELDEDFVNADLRLNLDISNMSDGDVSDFGVDVKLFDADGVDIFEQSPMRADVPKIPSGERLWPQTDILDPQTTAYDNRDGLKLERHITAPHLWSDEDPYLYTLVITLYDKIGGRHFGSLSQQLGFREITFTKTAVSDDGRYDVLTTEYEQIKINGKPLIIKGANRHDNDAFKGRYVSKELYEKDMKLLKLNNFNALRTAHYPNDNYLYYLADKYGIFVMAEANMESHAMEGLPGDAGNPNNVHAPANDSDELFSHMYTAYKDRLIANMEARKNRTSVLIWSLGNECGITPGSKALQRSMQEVVRPFDPTRPISYERLRGMGGVDIKSSFYPSPGDIASNFGSAPNNMPYIALEYSHGRGNGSGFFAEYWEVFREHDNLMGGFIWDYIDTSISTPLPEVIITDFVEADKGVNNLRGILREGAIVDNPDSPGEKVLDGILDFAGSSLKFNEVLSGTNSFTMEVYFKYRDSALIPDRPGNQQNFNMIMGKGDRQISLRTADNNGIDVVAHSDGGWRPHQYRSLPSALIGNWHHLAVTFDHTATGSAADRKIAAYLNGSPLNLANDPTVFDTLSVSTDDFALNFCTETKRKGNNLISTARIYNRALSPTEIESQRQSILGKTAPPIGPDSDNVFMWIDFNQYNDILLPDRHVWDFYDYLTEYHRQKGNADKVAIYEPMAGRYYGYGGNWNDTPNDSDNCANGVLLVDRTPNPDMQEIKYVHQSVWFSATQRMLEQRQVQVYNEYKFLNTKDTHSFKWELVEDGSVLDSGILSGDAIDTPPEGTAAITVPFTMPAELKENGEYFLNLYAVLSSGTAYADAGYVAAHQQMQIDADISKLPPKDPGNTAPDLEDDDGMITISGDRFNLTIDKSTGLITEYQYDGREIFKQGPLPNYWRAPTGNDPINSYNSSNTPLDERWRTANLNMETEDITTELSNGGKTITVSVRLNLPNANDSKQFLTYTVYHSGEINIVSTLKPAFGLRELLKFGAEITLPKGYENITWYGDGPAESFRDRRAGSMVGLYSSTVTESFFPYTVPQTSGNKTGVRYITLEDPDNPVGLMVAGRTPMEASALPFSVKDYEGKRHPYEMVPTDYTILNIDNMSRGVGQQSHGPGMLSKYQMRADRDYSYEYTIIPYDKESDEPMELSRAWRIAAEPEPDPNGHDFAFAARFSDIESTWTVNKDSGTNQALYADWRTLDGGRALDVQNHPNLSKLRLRLVVNLSSSDQSLPASGAFTGGFVKLRSPNMADKPGDPSNIPGQSTYPNDEHNFGWDINSAWNLQYGDNLIDIPLEEFVKGAWNPGGKYGTNNRRGLMDWSEVQRIIFVINTPLGNPSSPYRDVTLTMRLSRVGIVDTTFEDLLAELDQMTQSIIEKGEMSEQSYSAYLEALADAKRIAANKNTILEDVVSAIERLTTAIDNLSKERLKGDVDNNGLVNVADIILVRNYILGERIHDISAADVNNDGVVNIFDMLVIRDMILRWRINAELRMQNGELPSPSC